MFDTHDIHMFVMEYHPLKVTYESVKEFTYVTLHFEDRTIKHEIAAQQNVQLTAYGAGWRERLGKFLIRWGCRLARIGGH